MKSILVLVFLALLAGSVSAEVVMSGHPDWSPVMYREGDNIVGIGPNLATMIMDDIGLNSTCKYAGSWQDVQELGKKGSVDLIVAAYATEDRKESFFYSEPYFEDPIGLFSIKSFAYKNHYDFAGHKIAVTRGDSYGKDMDEFLSVFSKDGLLTVNEYATIEDALISLQSGESDLLLYSSYSGQKTISSDRFKNVKEVAVVGSQPFHMLMSKKSKYVEVLPLINNFIELYKNNGELDKIINSTEKHAGF